MIKLSKHLNALKEKYLKSRYNLFIPCRFKVEFIASAASSNDNAYAYRGNSGELHCHQAKISVNLP